MASFSVDAATRTRKLAVLEVSNPCPCRVWDNARHASRGTPKACSPVTGCARCAYQGLEVVDCAEIRQGFMAGLVPSGRAMHAHLQQCAHCRELFGDAELGCRLASAVPRTTGALTEQLLSTEALIAAEHGPRAFLRSRPTWARGLLSLLFAAAFLVRELFGARIPMGELGALRVVGVLLSFALLGLVAYSALRPWPLARRAARSRAMFAWLAWSLPCALWFAPEARAASDDFSSTGFALRSLACFGYGSALSAPSVALLWAFDRGVGAPYRVWALGAGWVALLSSSILLLHCPSSDRAHLLVGHCTIGLAWFLAVSIASWWRSSVR